MKIHLSILLCFCLAFSNCSKDNIHSSLQEIPNPDLPVITKTFNTLKEADEYVALTKDGLKEETTLYLDSSIQQLNNSVLLKSQSHTENSDWSSNDGWRTWYLKFPNLESAQLFPYILVVDVLLPYSGDPAFGGMSLNFGTEYFPGKDFSINENSTQFSFTPRVEINIRGSYIFQERIVVGSVVAYINTYHALATVKFTYNTRHIDAYINYTKIGS